MKDRSRRSVFAGSLFLGLVGIVAACSDAEDTGPTASKPDASADASTSRHDAGKDRDADVIVDEDASDGELDADVADAADPDDAADSADGQAVTLDGTSCDEAAHCLLTLDPTVGVTTEGVYEQGKKVLDRPKQPGKDVDYDGCYEASGFKLESYYAYVEVKNPGASDVVAEIRLDTPPGGSWVYTYASAYASLPVTTNDRNACLSGVNDGCPSADGLTDPRWPCLIGSAALTIPKNGSVWIYVPSHSPPAQPAGAKRAQFVLRATVTQTKGQP